MATWTTPNKSSSTWITQVRAGQGWLYDQANLTYDGPIDNISQNAVLYDSEGLLPAWTNTNKSITSWTTTNKN